MITWPAPTDFVGADAFDELWWNIGANTPPEVTPVPPTLDLPATVVDYERGHPPDPTVPTVGLAYTGTEAIAAVLWPAHPSPEVMPAGVGPAWFLDGLTIGQEYGFTVDVMQVEENYGATYPPAMKLKVLGTTQETPFVGPAFEYVTYTITFTAEAAAHHVALLTEEAWETGGGGNPGSFTFHLANATLTMPPISMEATFTIPAPGFMAELTTEDVWDDPEPDDPEDGGSDTPPEPPPPRELPAVVPDTVYVGWISQDGTEAPAPRVPVEDMGYDEDTELLSILEEVTAPPTSVTVVAAGLFAAPSGGEPITVGPMPMPVLPGSPIVVLPDTVAAPVVPNPRLRRVSEIMPAPTLDAQGFPVDWTPTTVIDEIYGRIQVVIEGEDISNLLGAPLPVPSWTRGEPFGSISASISVPQITAFHKLSSFSWLRKGANVDIRLIRRGQTNVRRFSGYLSTFGHHETTGVFTLECIGALFQADQQLRLPSTDTRPKDVGVVIRRTLNQVVGRRYQRVPKRITGAKTSTVGAWEPRLTGYIQQLLATAIDKKGRQWTVECPARNPRIVRKNLTDISWTISNGQRGIRVDLQSDDMPNVIYGEGVREDGGRWRNMKYPNWRPDDTPPFPNWSPIRSIGVGTTDAQTDSGNGVSVWQEKVGQKVTGTFSQDDRRVLQERQRAAGILVDGWLGPQSWATEFATGSNTGSLDGAFPMPLAYNRRVMPRLYGGDGADLGPNPNYNPRAIRVEEKIDFGQGVSLKEARRAAKAQLKRDSGRGWTGEIGFTLDPEEISRFDVLEGSNGLIKHFRGNTLQVHVAQVRYGPDEVVATVDTRARDYPTLAAIRERERNATDPAKAYVKRPTDSKLNSDRAEWDAEAPGGRIPNHAIYGGLWTVLRIPVAAYGSIVRTEFRTTNPASRFAVAVFDRPITAARLNSLVGNVLATDENPWQDQADELDDAGLLMAWGWAKQPLGYYPKAYHTPDGESLAPVTGRFVDDAAWDYASTRPPWLWVAEIANTTCQIRGRFFHGV